MQAEFTALLQQKEAQIAELNNRLFVATDQLIRLRGFLTQHASEVTKAHRQLDTDYETTDDGGDERPPAEVAVPMDFDEDIRIPMDTAPLLCKSIRSTMMLFQEIFIAYLQMAKL